MQMIASLVLMLAATTLSVTHAPPAGAPDPGAPAAAQGSAPAQGSGSATKKSPPAGGESQPKATRGPGMHYGIPKAPSKAPGMMRIAAYNLQNLFDHADDPSLKGEWDDMKLAVTDDRAKGLAEAIRRLDADILCLEEIESKEALTWFRDTYLEGMGYDYIASLDAGYYRGVEQSVLSRYPLARPRVFLDARLTAPAGSPPATATDDPTKFQRSPLAVDVELPGGYVLHAFVIHHKAGGEKFDVHREAEAAKVIELVQAELKKDPKANIVVVGDFNATPLSDVRKKYKDAGLRNGYDFRSAKDQAAGRDKGASKEQRQAVADRYTTHESGRAIDYILCSDGFAADIEPGSFFVLSSLHPGDAYDWRKDTPPAGYASDHYPIALDFSPHDGPLKIREDAGWAQPKPKPKTQGGSPQ